MAKNVFRNGHVIPFRIEFDGKGLALTLTYFS
jgi:hypothetical protein